MTDLYHRVDSEKSREASLERALTEAQNELWRAQWAGRAEERRRANCPWPNKTEADKDAEATPKQGQPSGDQDQYVMIFVFRPITP